MVEEIQRLFRYELWANRLVYESLRQPDPPAKATHLFAHILAGQEVWLTRLHRKDSNSIELFPDSTVSDCGETMARIEPMVESYLGSLTEEKAAESIWYRNQHGKEYEHTARDILTHLAMHSHYHRGQIATRLRDAGLHPNNTDFIQYLRTGGK